MKTDSAELFRGILLAHLILLLHLVFIAGLGLVVIFFRGVSQYLLSILLGLTAVLIASAFFFYHKFKARGKQTLKDIQASDVFEDRSFEIRFLGGMASLKFGQPGRSIANVAPETHDPRHQLEDPDTIRIRELAKLANMLEKDLITPEEFIAAKKRLLK